jgi:hypothetical protein
MKDGGDDSFDIERSRLSLVHSQTYSSYYIRRIVAA